MQAAAFGGGDAGRILATMLKHGEAVVQGRTDCAGGHDSNDAAHALLLIFGLSPRVIVQLIPPTHRQLHLPAMREQHRKHSRTRRPNQRRAGTSGWSTCTPRW